MNNAPGSMQPEIDTGVKSKCGTRTESRKRGTRPQLDDDIGAGEVSEILRISLNIVWVQTKKEVLPHTRRTPGGNYRYSRAEIQKIAKERKPILDMRKDRGPSYLFTRNCSVCKKPGHTLTTCPNGYIPLEVRPAIFDELRSLGYEISDD